MLLAGGLLAAGFVWALGPGGGEEPSFDDSADAEGPGSDEDEEGQREREEAPEQRRAGVSEDAAHDESADAGDCVPREHETPEEKLPSGWDSLPPPPEGAGTTALWTDAELLLLGGAAGAAYDPEAGIWRCLAPSPLGEGSQEGVAVWTGVEAVWWTARGAAAYHPQSDRWRQLPDMDLRGGRPLVAVWSGEEVLAWTGLRGGRSVVHDGGIAYDPATDRHRAIPSAPTTLNAAQALWTGTEMVVYGSELTHANHSGARTAQGVAYDPARDRWREIAPGALSPQATSIAWAGDEMLVWDYLLSAAVYDPDADDWHEVGGLPLRSMECYPDSARVREHVLAWYCGQAALYDSEDRTWEEVGTPSEAFGGPLVSTGSEALLVETTAQGTPAALWRYRPPGAGSK